MHKPRVLFCTAYGNTFGIGHFKRCLSIIKEAEAVKNFIFEPLIYIYKGDIKTSLKTLSESCSYNIIDDLNKVDRIDLIVSDMRDTIKREMVALCKIAPVVSIDDSGAGSNYSYVSIKSMLALDYRSGNYNGAEYIVLNSELKKIRTELIREKEDVVMSFGGEDPYNLTEYVALALNQIGIKPVIIKGPLYKYNLDKVDASIIEDTKDIYKLINNAKVLITSFGITMYEAFFLKTPVILVNHTEYHDKLANMLPVINLGYKDRLSNANLREELLNIINNNKLLIEKAEKNARIVDQKGAGRIVNIIQRTLDGKRKDCLFGHKLYRAIVRTDIYTIFQCERCRDLFLFKLNKRDSIYEDKDYFTSKYKDQYGKTYEEDKPNIVNVGRRRMETIEKINRKKGKILDIGCAMGFFLEVAKDSGWEEYGIEISHYASELARNNLLLNIKTASFIDVELKEELFDAVTLFYVAEHFPDIEKVIKKVYKILKLNGVIAIAIPNRGGISFRMNKNNYMNEHPCDHYIDTNPKNIKRFLRQYGFITKRIVSTGIHSERFFNKIGISNNILLAKLYDPLAKLFKLGDTFEYYGVKI